MWLFQAKQAAFGFSVVGTEAESLVCSLLRSLTYSGICKQTKDRACDAVNCNFTSLAVLHTGHEQAYTHVFTFHLLRQAFSAI